MCLDKILFEVDQFKKETEELRQISPVYPAILLKGYPWKGQMIASTILKVVRGNKHEDVHCVERGPISSGISQVLVAKLNMHAERILEFYIISEDQNG